MNTFFPCIIQPATAFGRNTCSYASGAVALHMGGGRYEGPDGTTISIRARVTRDPLSTGGFEAHVSATQIGDVKVVVDPRKYGHIEGSRGAVLTSWNRERDTEADALAAARELVAELETFIAAMRAGSEAA